MYTCSSTMHYYKLIVDNPLAMQIMLKKISLQHLITATLIACLMLDIIPDHKIDSFHYLSMLFTHAYFLKTLHITPINPHNILPSNYLIGTISALYYSASIFKLVYWKIAVIFTSIYKFLLNIPRILIKPCKPSEIIVISSCKLSLEVSYAFISIP